ncbi:hypothetical protein H4R34_003333 [Dimargaris verticillata]|uniref:Uncharacterized protein n=1 Tax=Dimargaris verticillata TaxID=2761393 RepID=A0A9W8B6A4_9FUNG|nr:hypothetical protein H4R34_003333 [Dimargaris verticillata]
MWCVHFTHFRLGHRTLSLAMFFLKKLNQSSSTVHQGAGAATDKPSRKPGKRLTLRVKTKRGGGRGIPPDAALVSPSDTESPSDYSPSPLGSPVYVLPTSNTAGTTTTTLGAPSPQQRQHVSPFARLNRAATEPAPARGSEAASTSWLSPEDQAPSSYKPGNHTPLMTLGSSIPTSRTSSKTCAPSTPASSSLRSSPTLRMARTSTDPGQSSAHPLASASYRSKARKSGSLLSLFSLGNRANLSGVSLRRTPTVDGSTRSYTPPVPTLPPLPNLKISRIPAPPTTVDLFPSVLPSSPATQIMPPAEPSLMDDIFKEWGSRLQTESNGPPSPKLLAGPLARACPVDSESESDSDMVPLATLNAPSQPSPMVTSPTTLAPFSRPQATVLTPPSSVTATTGEPAFAKAPLLSLDVPSPSQSTPLIASSSNPQRKSSAASRPNSPQPKGSGWLNPLRLSTTITTATTTVTSNRASRLKLWPSRKNKRNSGSTSAAPGLQLSLPGENSAEQADDSLTQFAEQLMTKSVVAPEVSQATQDDEVDLALQDVNSALGKFLAQHPNPLDHGDTFRELPSGQMQAISALAELLRHTGVPRRSRYTTSDVEDSESDSISVTSDDDDSDAERRQKPKKLKGVSWDLPEDAKSSVGGSHPSDVARENGAQTESLSLTDATPTEAEIKAQREQRALLQRMLSRHRHEIQQGHGAIHDWMIKAGIDPQQVLKATATWADDPRTQSSAPVRSVMPKSFSMQPDRTAMVSPRRAEPIVAGVSSQPMTPASSYAGYSPAPNASFVHPTTYSPAFPVTYPPSPFVQSAPHSAPLLYSHVPRHFGQPIESFDYTLLRRGEEPHPSSGHQTNGPAQHFSPLVRPHQAGTSSGQLSTNISQVHLADAPSPPSSSVATDEASCQLQPQASADPAPLEVSAASPLAETEDDVTPETSLGNMPLPAAEQPIPGSQSTALVASTASLPSAGNDSLDPTVVLIEDEERLDATLANPAADSEGGDGQGDALTTNSGFKRYPKKPNRPTRLIVYSDHEQTTPTDTGEGKKFKTNFRPPRSSKRNEVYASAYNSLGTPVAHPSVILAKRKQEEEEAERERREAELQANLAREEEEIARREEERKAREEAEGTTDSQSIGSDSKYSTDPYDSYTDSEGSYTDASDSEAEAPAAHPGGYPGMIGPGGMSPFYPYPPTVMTPVPGSHGGYQYVIMANPASYPGTTRAGATPMYYWPYPGMPGAITAPSADEPPKSEDPAPSSLPPDETAKTTAASKPRKLFRKQLARLTSRRGKPLLPVLPLAPDMTPKDNRSDASDTDPPKSSLDKPTTAATAPMVSMPLMYSPYYMLPTPVMPGYGQSVQSAPITPTSASSPWSAGYAASPGPAPMTTHPLASYQPSSSAPSMTPISRYSSPMPMSHPHYAPAVYAPQLPGSSPFGIPPLPANNGANSDMTHPGPTAASHSHSRVLNSSDDESEGEYLDDSDGAGKASRPPTSPLSAGSYPPMFTQTRASKPTMYPTAETTPADSPTAPFQVLGSQGATYPPLTPVSSYHPSPSSYPVQMPLTTYTAGQYNPSHAFANDPRMMGASQPLPQSPNISTLRLGSLHNSPSVHPQQSYLFTGDPSMMLPSPATASAFRTYPNASQKEPRPTTNALSLSGVPAYNTMPVSTAIPPSQVSTYALSPSVSQSPCAPGYSPHAQGPSRWPSAGHQVTRVQTTPLQTTGIGLAAATGMPASSPAASYYSQLSRGPR